MAQHDILLDEGTISKRGLLKILKGKLSYVTIAENRKLESNWAEESLEAMWNPVRWHY